VAFAKNTSFKSSSIICWQIAFLALFVLPATLHCTGKGQYLEVVDKTPISWQCLSWCMALIILQYADSYI
jgi:hypothetical protein